MMTIYKYTIAPDRCQIWMPVGARVFSAGVQGDEVRVWAIVDSEEQQSELREFYTVGTGHPLELQSRDRFLHTVFMGPLVFHVFYVPKREEQL